MGSEKLQGTKKGEKGTHQKGDVPSHQKGHTKKGTFRYFYNSAKTLCRSSVSPGRLMIYEDRVILDNPATQYFHQPITPDNLASHPKNPSICKFMIQLGRFDKLGSGVINIHKYLPVYANGAQPLFEDTREGFRLTLPLSLLSDKHDEATGVAGQVTGIEPGLESGVESEQVTGQVTGQVASLLNAIADGPFSRKELMAKLSLKGRDNFEKLYLTPALAQGLIEMTIPDKPNSRLQKYRLTDKGRKIIVALKNK